jgi:pimeloyl-ACP methyl ester carboxylesterase
MALSKEVKLILHRCEGVRVCNLTMKFQQIIVIMLLTTTMGYSQTQKKTETVRVNGTNVYYEVYGKGKPLLFLHGFTHSSKSWLPYLNDYAKEFEVYLVDLKGHGKSDPFKETLSIQAAARDVDGLIRHLQLESIDAIGYSYGGDVLFQLALLRPELIKSMVVIGACGICNIRDFPQWIDYLSYKNIEDLPWMREAHQSEEQIKSILTQVANYNVTVSEAEFRSITARVLLVMGDGEDSILWDDILKAKNNLPNVSLWVIPNTGHRAHKDANMDAFIKVSKEFLNKKTSSTEAKNT